MPDRESSKRSGAVGSALAAGRLVLRALMLLLLMVGAVVAVVVVTVLVRFEALRDIAELGVDGTALTVASAAIAVLFVGFAGWIWQSDRSEAGLSLLHRIGRRASAETSAADPPADAAVRLRVRGEVAATSKEMGERMFSWLANEAFGTTWTVWLDVYEAVRVEADGERREPSVLGLLELNGSSAAGLGKLHWRDLVRLECTGGGRVLGILDREDVRTEAEGMNER
jgi:hypothetical protein